ncbi:MAG TPA: hypothetical protein PK493_10310, partial [Pseudomonadota bacterium]|nr:hypothetical protein [Pseudomonadota bacterium]
RLFHCENQIAFSPTPKCAYLCVALSQIGSSWVTIVGYNRELAFCLPQSVEKQVGFSLHVCSFLMQSSAAVPVTGVASPEKLSGRNNDEHSSAYRRDS